MNTLRLKNKISAVISAYNEEDKIEDCLKSAELVADEIIFVDNSSQDKTVQIAKKFTKNIFIVENDPVMLNRNKNFGFSKASTNWIISLDSDERITEELAKEIKNAIQKPTINGYEIPRKNIIFGKWIQHSIWWPDYNLRLFRKNKGKFSLEHVHEKMAIMGETGKLESPLIHLNYQTVYQFLNKLNNTYTESEADNFINKGKQIYWFDAIRWPAGDFFKTFFLEEGFKDGLHGLVLSLLQAFYSLIVFAKIWEKKDNFKDITPDNFLKLTLSEFSKLSKEAKYWIFTTLIKENKSKGFYLKLKRKFR